MDKKRTPWNKGQTKTSNDSVRKISETMRRKRIDNFAAWRSKRPQGQLPYLKKCGDLAELCGAVLGDGSLHQFERTQYLRISCNSNNPEWVSRCSTLITKTFRKEPSVIKRKDSNCIDITLYQNKIAERLEMQTGAKTHRKIDLPNWVLKKPEYIIRYLRGLYETDGCLCRHKGTYTHKLIFSNKNLSLLDQVYFLWKHLGFNPHRSKGVIQISRKEEVTRASKLIKFRNY